MKNKKSWRSESLESRIKEGGDKMVQSIWKSEETPKGKQTQEFECNVYFENTLFGQIWSQNSELFM